MAKRQVIDCDRCGERGLPQPVSFTVELGSYFSAEGRTESRDYDVDLCVKCASLLLGNAYATLGTNVRSDLLQSLKPPKI